MLSVFSVIATQLQPFAELFQLRSVRRLSSITSANWRWFANAARSNCSIQIREAVELEVTQMAADRFPQTNATTSTFHCRVKKPTTSFLNLIHREGQKHQRRQHRRQVLIAVSVVVFQTVALILQRVKRFVLNPPAATARLLIFM